MVASSSLSLLPTHHAAELTRNTIYRLFPYMVVSGSLGVFFIFLVLFLAAQRFLLPGIIIIGSFILFVLWLTGLIETSLQLYGVVGNVNDNCQNYVVENPSTGNNINTLAWLTQSTICMSVPIPFSSVLGWKAERCL